MIPRKTIASSLGPFSCSMPPAFLRETLIQKSWEGLGDEANRRQCSLHTAILIYFENKILAICTQFNYMYVKHITC